MATWDPARYLAFADERGRPFVDLTARIGADHPARVVDLGCGPGQLTRMLLKRWPDAEVVGIDSSPEMIARAQEEPTRSADGSTDGSATGSGSLRFEVADLRDWEPSQPVDAIVSNATLQWVPDHRAQLPRLVDALTPDGWLAFQVPGNFGEPSHVLLHELAADPRFAEHTVGVERPAAFDPEVYLSDLLALGCRVDAWETTYLHLLTGENPVFTWISGTGARPVLQALPDELREVFVAEYQQRLREAYPPRPQGTILPFRRVFAVARRG